MSKNNISSYTDPTGTMSYGQLKFAGWYLRHKIFLIKIGIGIMIAFCSVTIGYSFWVWGEYLFVGYTRDQNTLLVGQVNQFENYTLMQPGYKAQDLTVSNIQTFRSAEDLYDLTANVFNQNIRWIARLSYHFTYAGGETPVESTILLPGDNRPAIAFGVGSKNYPTGVNFVVDKVVWRIVDPHEYKDIESYMKPRLDFVVNNFEFHTTNSAGLNIASVTFDLMNNSAYSYWRPVFYLELLNGDSVAGYMHISIDKFLSGETKKIDVRYFGDNISASNYRLVPVLNIFDPDVYISPEK